ncbi:MAG: hypothetical protein HRF49_06920 [bacterium]
MWSFRHCFLAAFAVAYAFALFGCNPADDEEQDALTRDSAVAGLASKNFNPDALFIAYTYDTNGKLESCGCDSRPLGGFPRRGTLMDSYRNNYGRSLIALDGGRLLPDNSDISKFKAQIMLKMMSKIGYSAMHVGHCELNFGIEELSKWADEAKFPLVNSNVLLAGGGTNLIRKSALDSVGAQDVSNRILAEEFYKSVTGKEPNEKLNWLANPVLILKSGNVRIGIVSATDPSYVERLGWKNLRALPMRDALKRLVALNKDSADLWVAMVEAGNVEIVNLMKALPEIKVWLTGNSKSSEGSVGHSKTQEGQYWQNVFLDGKYLGISSIDLREGNLFVSQEEVPIEMSNKPREDLQLILVSEWRPKVEEIYSVQAQPIGGKFVSAEQCRKCHPEQYEKWKSTGHSAALATLESEKKNFSKECVKCHVEYDSVNDRQYSLQCTTCHYRAWEKHIEEAESGGPVTKLDEKIDKMSCLRCHNPPEGESIEECCARYFGMIKHWDGPVMPDEGAA